MYRVLVWMMGLLMLTLWFVSAFLRWVRAVRSPPLSFRWLMQHPVQRTPCFDVEYEKCKNAE
jgi:hypothetical protein